MIDEIEGAGFMPNDTAAVFSGIVIMAFYLICREIVFLTKPGNELDERFVCSVGEFTRGIGMATFNGDRGIVAFGRTDRPRDLIQRHTLKNGAVKINDKMSAYVIFVFEIFPVLESGGFRIGNVVNDDIF